MRLLLSANHVIQNCLFVFAVTIVTPCVSLAQYPHWIAVGRSSGDNMRWAVHGDKTIGFAQLISRGQGRGDDRGVTAVAFCNMDEDPQKELAIGWSAGENARWAIYDDADAAFARLMTEGENRGEGRGVTALACGNVDDDAREEIAVGWNPGENMRWAIYDDANADFERLVSRGEDRGASRGVTALAFGNVDDDPQDELAVGWNPGENMRWAIYDNANARFERLPVPGGEDRGASRGVTALAFGNVDDDPQDELAVGWNPGENMRWAIYDDANAHFERLVSRGEDRGASRGVTALAFGNVDHDPQDELAVGWNPGENMKWAIYDDANARFERLPVSGGENRGESRGVTALAFGNVDDDTREELAVGWNRGANARWFVFDDAIARFARLTSEGAGWGDSRGVTALAVGDVGSRCLQGYVWPLSTAPGGRLAFKVSGRGDSREVEFFRHNNDASPIRIGRTSITPRVQFTNSDPWRNGSGWETVLEWTVPANWPSGIYSATFRCPGGAGSSHVTFIVKPARLRRSTVAVVANVNTWLAYNRWGGAGKYCTKLSQTCEAEKPARVSFLRPNPNTSPVGRGFGPSHLTRGELWVLGWLEGNGIGWPDVYTDIDFDNGEVNRGGYRVLVLSTHPEYWTERMYDNLTAFLDGGGSLLYLGGNGIYEKAEYIDGQTRMSFRGGRDGQDRERALFRMIGKPERALLGVATEACGVPGAPYRVAEGQSGHYLFRGTGLRDGDEFGREGLNTGCGSSCNDPDNRNGGASGWEVDTSNGRGAIGIPFGCSESQPNFPAGDGPAAVPVVLARADGRGAEMVYYEHPKGGFVFSAGSITFGGSLVVDRAIQQIVRNALAEADRRR